MSVGKFSEAAAIGVPDSVKGTALVIVCALRPDVTASEELEAEVAQAVSRGLGPPFRPKAVLLVSDLPKTRNLKIMRRVIRAACLGESPGDVSSLVNPESLDEIHRRWVA